MPDIGNDENPVFVATLEDGTEFYNSSKGMYGSYLYEGTFYHKRYNARYKARIQYLTKIFERVLTTLTSDEAFPNLKGKIALSYPNIVAAETRYFNDLVRLRTFHKIRPTHPTKMVAYTLRWMNFFPPLVCICTPEEFDSLSDAEKLCVREIKVLSAIHIMEYFALDSIKTIASKPKLFREFTDEIGYVLFTDAFEPHCIALLLKYADI